jgi:predicted  nucleic acid-binding Zn-ribbon protein
LRDDNVRLAAECNSLREDANFFNKRINWLEETVASLEVQLQSESERKQVAEAKMVFLVSKLQLYEEAAEEITAKVMEETSLKG